MLKFLAAATLVVGGVSVSSVAHADDDEIKWDMKFKIESDLRFRLESKSIGTALTEQSVPAGVERNQNLFGAQVSAAYDSFKAVAQADLVVFGYQTELHGFDAISDTNETQPYRLDINELYVEARGLVVDGFDLRVGQQLVLWGVADQFNPTNNLNPDDLVDPLQFGKQLGNFMVKGDFWVTEEFSISAVLVPLFKPARLPPTAKLGLAAIDRLPFLDEGLRWRITSERAAAASVLSQNPTVVDQVTTQLPEPAFDNMQAAFRIAGTIAEQDWALSYYNGRTDFPQPLANHTHQSTKPLCARFSDQVCSQGALLTDVTLGYPRMHVYGLNITGEFNPFKGIDEDIPGIGYRLEGALIVPTKTKIKLTNDDLKVAGFAIPAGEYDYDADNVPGGPRPTVVDDEPFLKWTLGLDYTFGSNVYVNLMWVHGLADEYGAGDWIGGTSAVRESGTVLGGISTATTCALPRDGSKCAREILRPRLGDFLIAGVDIHMLDDQALLRLFTILEMSGYEESTVDTKTNERVKESLPFYTADGFSASVFPEFSYNFGNGLELGAGALFNLGKTYTKFGDPAAGGSLGYLRGRYTL